MRQLTIERAATAIIFMLLFALAVRIPVDTDTWWHIRSGQHTLTEGMIYADPFSATRLGEPWINHSWGAQIALYGAWALAGDAGLALYTALLATAGMAILHRLMTGNAYVRAFALIIGAATAAVFWSARPQMFSFALSAAALYLVYDYKRRGGDRVWLLVPLMILWVNLHAGFTLGFLILGGVIVAEALGNLLNPGRAEALSWSGIRKLALVTVACAAALVINPYGPQIYSVPFETVGIGALQQFIQEWNSPDFHGRQTWPFIALLLGTLGLVGASRTRLDWSDYLLLAGSCFMALLAGRNIAFFAVVATPIFARHLDSVIRERGWLAHTVQHVTPRMARLNAFLIGAVGFAALMQIVVTLNPAAVRAAQATYLPVDAAAYLLRESPEGPLFNSYNWGGYLLFAAPDYPVFVDGRTDLYGDALLRTYLRLATAAPGWRELLDEYAIRLVLVESTSGLDYALRVEPDWTLAYEDELAVIYMRAGDA